LCEENYRYMSMLAPGLHSIHGSLLSRVENSMDLYLEILEQTPYTTLVHLTYYFQHQEGQRPDPDAIMRAFHDARQIEILNLQQRILPVNRGMQHPTLGQKWKVNLFASKWLAYCVGQGHSFSRESRTSANGKKQEALV